MHSGPILAVAALLVACSAPLEPPARELGRPLQTERLEYELRSTDRGLEVSIPFTYTNGTGKTVYVANCNRVVPPALDKQVGGQWVRALSMPVPLCLSPPIVVQPGQLYKDTLRLIAGRPSDNLIPKFEVEEIEGTQPRGKLGLFRNSSSGTGQQVWSPTSPRPGL